MNNWKIPFDEPNIPDELLKAGYPPLLAAVLSLHGITTEKAAAEKFGDSPILHDPLDMLDMPVARDRILQAIERGEKVAVYGDYDVDGITATCLLSDYLAGKGLECIRHIPNREDEGYGLNSTALDDFCRQGVSLVITVDCGITAVEEAAHAREVGIDLIITDHHECPPDVLPDAVAVVDMKRSGDEYPNKTLAGVGVAFKLVCACESSSENVLKKYADLVAIGTVADVMPLTGENRYLVKTGLKMINQQPRPWISALLGDPGSERREITASTIGYSLAPRLNASGRLGKAEVALKLLSSSDPGEVQELAATLMRLNEERKGIEQQIWQEALAELGPEPPTAPIVLAGDDWNQGVIGIVASRLSEQYSLPSIMICLNGDAGKGSCRSYGSFDLYKALSACSDHLLSFGGHALAAGFRLERRQIDGFRRALADYYLNNMPEAVYDVEGKLLIRDPALLSVKNVAALPYLEPYGTDNEKPVMILYGVPVEHIIGVGGNRHTKLKAILRNTDFDCIYFSHSPEETGLTNGCLADIAFTPQINEYHGRTSVQLMVCAVKPHTGCELCRCLLEHDPCCRGAASGLRPGRDDFRTVWYLIRQEGFRVGQDWESLLSQSPEGMSPVCFFICLLTFYETGLLKNNETDSLFGASAVHTGEKVDLDSAPTLQMLDKSKKH